MNAATLTAQRVSVRLLLTGAVQGSGIRPKIARLAVQHGLGGCVRNCQSGVEIEAVGLNISVDLFVRTLQELVPDAQIEQSSLAPSFKYTTCESSDAAVFSIDDSQILGPAAFVVPLDCVICKDCLDEVMTPGNRRFGYALNSCAECGPRYSILRSMPYDRQRTSMSVFPMCVECNAEYTDILHRRYHAQTNACPACGPSLWFVSSHTGRSNESDSIQAAVEAILRGDILAVKGVGGYQLICDATNDVIVQRLRERKGRAKKPLAVMVESLDAARQLAHIDPIEELALTGVVGPIVLVRSIRESQLAKSVHPELSDVGLMLPTTALHALLMARVGRPIIVTSGNLEGEPIEYQEESAIRQLQGVADCFLHHDRPILRPIDDSVVRCMAGRQVILRSARGISPMSLKMDWNAKSNPTVLAVGGHQKAAIAISNGKNSVLGPHTGDLTTLANRDRYMEQQRELCNLYHVASVSVAHDLHSDYFTTVLAKSLTGQLGSSQSYPIQHHHAHVVAGMLEHGWLHRHVLGFAFDGTGAGSDNTIWGGEVLLCTATAFRRVARIRPIALVGGETAIRQPWRLAFSLLHDTFGDEAEAIASKLQLENNWLPAIAQMLKTRSLVPSTSSVGRLFDGVASIVCGASNSDYEGEAAMRLESLCSANSDGAYRFDHSGDTLLEMDWRPLIRALVADRLAGTAPGSMAMRFHRAVADCISNIAERFLEYPIVLSGGVFQNRILVELVAALLSNHPQSVGLPGAIPPNDGGLAAGQLAIANYQQSESHLCA